MYRGLKERTLKGDSVWGVWLTDTQDVQVKRIHKNVHVISVVMTVEPVRQHRRRRARYV